MLADFRPSGKYVMEDLHKIGGVPAVMKYLLSRRSAARRLSDGDGKDSGRKFRRITGFERRSGFAAPGF